MGRIFNEQRVAEWPAPRTLCGLQDTGPLLILVGGKARPIIPLKEGGGAGGPSGDIWAYEYATKQWQLLSEDASAAAGRAGKVPGEEGEVRGFNEVDRPLTGSEAQTDKLPGLEGLSFAWMHHPNYGVVWGGYERGNEYSDGLYKLDITPACVQDKKCKYQLTDTEQCGSRHGVVGCINGKCECNPAYLQASFAGTEGLPKAVAVTPVTDIACPMGCPAALPPGDRVGRPPFDVVERPYVGVRRADGGRRDPCAEGGEHRGGDRPAVLVLWRPLGAADEESAVDSARPVWVECDGGDAAAECLGGRPHAATAPAPRPLPPLLVRRLRRQHVQRRDVAL